MVWNNKRVIWPVVTAGLSYGRNVLKDFQDLLG
jgi:hypothetical protein